MSLVNIDDALKFMLKRAKIQPKTQIISIKNAINRVLAKDVISTINVPGFDNSAMDGYAISFDDENNKKQTSFEITNRITAGSNVSELNLGCAARIFTGAPIPKGANVVIMQEECELINDKKFIKVQKPIIKNENIRPCGNDIKSGEIILKKGTKLKPQDIALAASVGVNEIEVFNKIKIGTFFTGDELVEPGEALQEGKIYNSNYYSITALANNLNLEIINLGNIKDDFSSTCQAIEELSKKCDLIVTTGGVSVGEEDHIKPAIEKLGTLDLWSIRIKPGKPLAFGKINNCAFVGLPGNPVSAMVTFLIFVSPFIKKMQGIENHLNKSRKVKIDFNWNRKKFRTEFVRVRLNENDLATMYPKQGSDVLSSMVWADGLLEIPYDLTFKKGDMLNFYKLNDIM